MGKEDSFEDGSGNPRKGRTLGDSRVGIGIGRHQIDFDIGGTLLAHDCPLGLLRVSHDYMEIFKNKDRLGGLFKGRIRLGYTRHWGDLRLKDEVLIFAGVGFPMRRLSFTHRRFGR